MLKLEYYRKEHCMSIRELSLKTGISRTYLTGIEEGVYKNPGIKVICVICKALDITPNDLIEESCWKK